MEARVTYKPDCNWREDLEQWREYGATHVYLATTGLGLQGADANIKTIETIRILFLISNFPTRLIRLRKLLIKTSEVEDVFDGKFLEDAVQLVDGNS